MTPELFAGVTADGERALVRELGHDEAARRLTAHRQSFITQADMAYIAGCGFDFVRLPIGYWTIQGGRGFIEGLQYVDAAFEWARQADIKIVLDFHGLQGSQNGHDHSGQVGPVRFYRVWHQWRALRTLRRMTQRYGHHPALLGLEVINEPFAPSPVRKLIRYYDRAVSIVRRYARSGTKIIVSDAYRPLQLAKALSKRDYGQDIVLDIHLYQVFGDDEKDMTLEQHVARAGDWKTLLDTLHQYVPAILVGEWSAALQPEAYKDGGTSKAYYNAQLRTFDMSAWGHSYWSYKTPKKGDWDWRSTFGPTR